MRLFPLGSIWYSIDFFAIFLKKFHHWRSRNSVPAIRWNRHPCLKFLGEASSTEDSTSTGYLPNLQSLRVQAYDYKSFPWSAVPLISSRKRALKILTIEEPPWKSTHPPSETSRRDMFFGEKLYEDTIQRFLELEATGTRLNLPALVTRHDLLNLLATVNNTRVDRWVRFKVEGKNDLFT